MGYIRDLKLSHEIIIEDSSSSYANRWWKCSVTSALIKLQDQGLRQMARFSSEGVARCCKVSEDEIVMGVQGLTSDAREVCAGCRGEGA